MEIREFYTAVDGDYDDVMSRLMKEDRVKKFLAMFAGSSEFGYMLDAYESKNYEELFRQSHSLKGMAYNLSLTRLGDAVSAVCETVRHGEPTEDISGLIEDAKTYYAQTIEAIKETV